MMMIYIPIAFASDDRGALLLGVALYSLLSSANSATRYRIYILDDRISYGNRETIQSLREIFECDIQFLPLHQILKEHITISFEQWPPTAFGRMFLPDLLPHEDAVLYLDIDTLVCRDLSCIFDIELGKDLVGAVYQADNQQSEEWKTRLRIPQQYGYFNSGVLYMNLKMMRKEHFCMKFLSYIKEQGHLLHCPDQDILNALLYDRVRSLAPAWNWPTSQTRKILFGSHHSRSGWGMHGYGEMVRAASHPYIIHFIGTPKPIHYNYKFHGRLYRHVWNQSPWKNKHLTGEKRIQSMMRRCLYVPFDCLIKLKIWFFLKQQRKDRNEVEG